MSVIKANIQVSPQDVFTTSSTQGTDLGAYATTGDGRVFRYAKAGATALVPGTLVQAPAEITTSFQALTPIACAAGVKTITLATSPHGSAPTILPGGFVVTTTGAGAGYVYKVSAAAIVSTSLVITLEDPIVVALTAASVVDLVQHPFNGVVINPSSATSTPLGAAIVAIPAANYGWIQTRGPAGLTCSAALTVGLGVSPSTTVAGYVTLATTASGNLATIVGVAETGVAISDCGTVNLTID